MQRESLGPRFQKVWTASAISLVGDGLILSALPLLIASATSSAALIAGLEVARGLPWLLFGLLGGVVADRLDRRRVMAVVDAGRCVAVGVLAVAVWRGHRERGPDLGRSPFLLGSGEVLFDNSAQTILPNLVDTDQDERANARFFVTENVARDLAGPAIGGAALRPCRVAAVRVGLGIVPRRASMLIFTLVGAATAPGRARVASRRRSARATRNACAGGGARNRASARICAAGPT